MSLRPPPSPLRLSSRPLVGVAVAVGLGIVAATRVPHVEAWGALVIAATATAAGHAAWTRRSLVTLRPTVLAAGVALAAFGAGGARMAAWSVEAPDSIAHVARSAAALDDAPSATVWARIADVPTASAWSVRFVADVDSVAVGTQAGSVSGQAQVALALTSFDDAPPLYPALRLGDSVRLTGDLQPPPRRRNPADFDYGVFLARRGVEATLRVRGDDAVQFLGASRRLDHLLANAVQRHVREAVARTVPSVEARSVLFALLLADRSGLDDATTDAFRETGLMHLLAVSGLHVFLVGLAVFVLLGPLLLRAGLSHRTATWARAGLALALLAVYALVTGWSVSVSRAFVMAAIVVLGAALQRRVDTLNSLGVAALLLLAFRPTMLFEVGFQLSFSAVAALVTLSPHFTEAVPVAWRAPGLRRRVSDSAVASIAATLGTAPVLLVHFGRVALGGLVLNLPAIPLTGATLGAGMGAVATAPVPILSETFGALADVCAQALVRVSTWGAERIGGAAVEGFMDDAWMVAALSTALAAGALWRRPVARLRAGLLALALVAVSLGASALRGESRPRLDVVFLDVGQGDATLLRLPNGRHVLIDAGVRSPYRDEGERTVVPHLERFGIRHLDAVVMTHADADHVGGIPSVLRSVSVGRLVHNGHTKDTEVWADLMHAADSLGVTQQTVQAGDRLDLDEAVRVRVLGPSAALASGGDANEASVVLLVEYGKTRWLLTGDAEAQGEAALVARYGPLLGADVVTVGHHGSRTSSSPALVAAASGRAASTHEVRRVPTALDSPSGPAFAIVSVAKRNRYGLPNAEPLMRWSRAGAEVLQTADEGAIWLRSDGTSVERVDWR